MRVALIILLSMSTQAFAAAILAVPPTPTPPASPTAKPAPSPEKFGKDWNAVKKNDDLLKDKSLSDEATKDGNLSQEASYVMVSNTLYGCVEVAANGRTDDICKSDPMHPECVGVLGAVQNATNCLEYFTPKSLGCKTYGTSEYGMAEWIAVGDQFQSQMASCAQKKSDLDSKQDAKKLTSLTELIGAQNYKASVPGGPDLHGMITAPSSGISGNLNPELDVSALDWNELAARTKDGASSLGYQEGDILRATLKGESFSTIVTESPFAQKLNYENRAKLDEGLADSKMIAQRVVQTYMKDSSGGEPHETSSTTADAATSMGMEPQPAQTRAAEPPSQVGGSVLPSLGNEASPSNSELANGTTSTNPPAPIIVAAEENQPPTHQRQMTESERLEAVAHAATHARLEKKAYRSPASSSQASNAEDPNTTLFHRISQAYRRQTAVMKPFDPRTGDLIRSMEKPEIFRNL